MMMRHELKPDSAISSTEFLESVALNCGGTALNAADLQPSGEDQHKPLTTQVGYVQPVVHALGETASETLGPKPRGVKDAVGDHWGSN